MNGVSEEAFDRIEEIKSQARQVFDELWEAAELAEGEILIVGCSSSEVASHRIGSWPCLRLSTGPAGKKGFTWRPSAAST